MNILIFRGKCKPNGINTALINLLNGLDPERDSITLLLVKSRRYDETETIKRISPKIKVIVKNTGFKGAVFEQLIRKTSADISKTKGFKTYLEKERDLLFGNEEFDAVIDFDGYNIYYYHLLLSLKGKHYVWLHNDMMSEMKKRSPWLKRNFAMYKRFDKVISCGESVCRINRENLSEMYDIPGEKFSFVSNLCDALRVKKLSSEICGISIPDDGIKFITCGRCSVEKNHIALIQAFKRIATERPETKLIILGNGPLYDKERTEAGDLLNNGRIIMPGNVANPYAVMNKCDCFILPSLHEGQPMVIKEARILGLPIIVSSFSSVKDCLIENGQLLTGNDADSLYDAMNAFMDGKVPSEYVYSGEQENKKALQEFFSVLS